MAHFSNIYGPEGQRNVLLTSYYVVSVRIIGLCVDFEPFFVNFVSFSPISTRLGEMLVLEVLNIF